MKRSRKTVLYIAVSVDGYIAKPGDDLSFLSRVERAGEDYGYSGFMETVDTVIMGRKTYDWIMANVPDFPHAEIDTYIITHTPRPSTGKTRFYTGDPGGLVAELRSRSGNNIFIDGGAEIVHELLKAKLIDEMVLSIIPVVLGNGVRLFKDGRPEQSLTLIGSKQFPSGLVQLDYVMTDD
jgi:dihydrofolate reductase